MPHIVAVGLRTPIGLTGASAAAAARAGICRIREHPFFIDPAGGALRSAYDGVLSLQLLGWQRVLALAESALGQVLSTLQKPQSTNGVLLLLSLPENRPGFGEKEQRCVAEGLRQFALSVGVPVRIHTVLGGHAGGLEAVRLGREQIREGREDLIIIGGAESYLDADTVRWLGERRQLVTKDTRSSFFPGEGAGFLALMSERRHRSERLPSLARVGGAAVARDPASKDVRVTPEFGLGLTAAIRLAAQELDAEAPLVHSVFADINGERWRSEAWGFAVLRLSELFVNAGDYEAPASCWGDLGAATGAALAALAIHAWQRGLANGPLSLLIASSQGGAHGAVLLRAGDRR